MELPTLAKLIQKDSRCNSLIDKKTDICAGIDKKIKTDVKSWDRQEEIDPRNAGATLGFCPTEMNTSPGKACVAGP